MYFQMVQFAVKDCKFINLIQQWNDKKTYVNRSWIHGWNAFNIKSNFHLVLVDQLLKPKTQKITERMQKFKGTRYSRYIYESELDKACFEHDMTYGNLRI